MNLLKKIINFFKKKERERKLNEEKNNKIEKENKRFIDYQKLTQDFSLLHGNKVETHVSDGDGLGINTKIGY